MKYLATNISKEEIINFLESSHIIPNSLCVVCLYTGESIVVNNDIHNHQFLKASGKFYEKEISHNGWIIILTEGGYSIVGDATLCPVNLLS